MQSSIIGTEICSLFDQLDVLKKNYKRLKRTKQYADIQRVEEEIYELEERVEMVQNNHPLFFIYFSEDL